MSNLITWKLDDGYVGTNQDINLFTVEIRPNGVWCLHNYLDMHGPNGYGEIPSLSFAETREVLMQEAEDYLRDWIADVLQVMDVSHGPAVSARA